jgi:hypothetical protein
VLIEQDEDGVFVAEVPSLCGPCLKSQKVVAATTVGAALCGRPSPPHCVSTQGRPRRAAPTVAPLDPTLETTGLNAQRDP